MRLMNVLPFSLTAILAAQTALTPAPQKPVAPAAKPAAKEAPKVNSLEAKFAKDTLSSVLDSVNAAWFGPSYQNITAVQMDGSIRAVVSASAINAKVAADTAGQVKGGATKSGNANVNIKTTYFANGDFKTDFSGDLGSGIWTRVGNKGFLYSKELNAYTTRVDPGPAEAPLSYMGWFREVIIDIRKVYAESSAFTATLGKEEGSGGETLQTLTFNAPTGAYDPKKREQNLTDTLGFWKRGRMDLTFEKTSKLPRKLNYTNEANGIRTSFNFTYVQGKLQTIDIANHSKGFDGPGGLRISYDANGLMKTIAGELNSQQKKIAFDMNLNWTKDLKSSQIAAMPPMTTGIKKMGGDELETYMLVGLAGNAMDLQRAGWNIMAPKVSSNAPTR
jgi:hypothetical protein